MKVIPAPLTTEESDAVVSQFMFPTEQRWLLVFESKQEAEDVMKYLQDKVLGEDGSLKSE